MHFPIVKRRKMQQSFVRITGTAHIIGMCGKEWDSPPEAGGKRKQQLLTTVHNHIHCNVAIDVRMHFILTSCV